MRRVNFTTDQSDSSLYFSTRYSSVTVVKLTGLAQTLINYILEVGTDHHDRRHF